MATPSGYEVTSWEEGYGDFTVSFRHLSTLRLVPWLEATAMVLCDVQDHHTGEPLYHSPRQILKKQLVRLDAMGFSATMATELEFFLFNKTAEEISRDGFQNLTPISLHKERGFNPPVQRLT